MCFERFCWDGRLHDTNASEPYEPPVKLGQPPAKTSGAGARYAFSLFIGTACLAVVVFLIMGS